MKNRHAAVLAGWCRRNVALLETWICIIDVLLFNFTQFPSFCMADGMGNVMESVRVCAHRSIQIHKRER
jgi:hypothetical protein